MTRSASSRSCSTAKAARASCSGARGRVPMPASKETVEQGKHFITMQGREVFKLAVKSMADAAEAALREAGLTPTTST